MSTQKIEIKTPREMSGDANRAITSTPTVSATPSNSNIETARKVITILTAVMLFFSLGHHPYSYYTTLRWVVCVASAWNGLHARASAKRGWVWLLLGIAILFNPILPIHLSKQAWAVIDVLAACVLVISVFGSVLHVNGEIKRL